jgi:hypothetical protein
MGITDFPGTHAGPGNVENFHMPDNGRYCPHESVRHESMPALTWKYIFT